MHFEALSHWTCFGFKGVKTYFLDGMGIFLAKAPIIALVLGFCVRIRLALVFCRIYSFAGCLQVSAEPRKTVYPITAVFKLSGYYEANIVQG